MTGPISARIPSSSSSSRRIAALGSSPSSTFPPGNSHLRACHFPAFRWPTSTCPLRSITAATTVVIVGRQLSHTTDESSLMYSQRLLDHFQNPRNVGELDAPAVTVEVSNPACGDILRLSVRFEGEVVIEARYKTRGCTASIAAGSVLTEWIAGKTRAELADIKPAAVEDAVGGLAVESKHAAVLCVDGVRAILKALRN